MKPKFRIRKTSKGYVVEYAVKRWFRVRWVHYISVAGISREPWYFSTEKAAIESLILGVRWDAIKNTNNQP